MPLFLNSDNPVIVVKPDQTPIYTGSTNFISHTEFDPYSASTDNRISILESGSTAPTILIPSGGTAVNNLSGNTWVVYSPTGGTGGGGITALVGSGGTWAGLLSGTTWIVYTPDWTGDILGLTMSAQTNYECCTGLTATFDTYTGATEITLSGLTVAGIGLNLTVFNHTGNTSIHTPYSAITQAIASATSGLTSSWSGLTGLPTDNSDLVDLLSGYSLTSHTHTQYALVTTVTGLTSSFTSHTGDTSIHFHMNDITGFTSSDSFDSHTGNTVIHYPMSGISITESQISDLQDYVLQTNFNTYTGTTAPASFLPITGLTGYWDSGQTVAYVTGYTPTLQWGNITGSISGQTDLWGYISGGTGGGTWGTITGDITGQTDLYDALNQKVDYPIYHDDLQTLGGIIDGYDAEFDLINNKFTSHTGNTTIHFLQSAITISESQISDLQDYALDSVVDGELLYKVDWVLYQDDLQTLGVEIDDLISGQTTLSASTLSLLYPTIKDVTGTTYTILAEDAGNVLEFSNTGATTVLFPTGLTTGLFVEIYNLGGQQITFSGDTGSTVNASGGNVVLSTLYGYAKARYRGNNKWIIYGWMTP